MIVDRLDLHGRDHPEFTVEPAMVEPVFFGGGLWPILPERARAALIDADRKLFAGSRGRIETVLRDLQTAAESFCFETIWDELVRPPMPYQTLMPVFQKDVLRVGPEGLGLLLAAPGVGAVLFTLALASFSGAVRRKGYILLAAMAALGISLILFSMATSLPVALLMLVAVGGCQILYNATNMTMLQLMVPDVLMGRVMSIYMINAGFSPAGALFAGISAQAFGAPITIAIMGAIVLALAIVMFFRNPEMRRILT